MAEGSFARLTSHALSFNDFFFFNIKLLYFLYCFNTEQYPPNERIFCINFEYKLRFIKKTIIKPLHFIKKKIIFKNICGYIRTTHTPSVTSVVVVAEKENRLKMYVPQFNLHIKCIILDL